MEMPRNPRLLVIDEEPQIRAGFRQAFAPQTEHDLDLDFAAGREDGLRRVREALAAHCPYSVAFLPKAAAEWREKFRAADPCLEVLVSSDPPPTAAVEIRRLVSVLVEKVDLARKTRLLTVAVEKANAAADAANRAKSEFLANISHEIRTPMTAILGYADLLCEQGLGPGEMTQHVRTIQKNRDHLLKLVDDILDVANLEKRAVSLEIMRCSPASILRETVAALARRAVEKDLTLTFGSADPIPETIIADPRRLRQILENLIANAIQFTERGGVDVRVRLLDLKDARGAKLAFDVTDTGIGLTGEQKDRLFRPFAGGETQTSRRRGSGLGLSLSLRLAEMMGGTIAVQSTPGSGSTFTATVETGPLAGIRMVPLKETHEPTAEEGDSTATFAKRLEGSRILLAEDGRDNQRLIQLYLARAGASVEIASDGAEAHAKALIAMAIGRPHDLILMDMQMPQMDGYEATRRLRTDGYKGPIVALTAHAMSGDRERCLAAGCDDYASKPIERKRLIDLCSAKLRPQSPSAARSFTGATLR